MNVCVLNCGSSSIKADIICTSDSQTLLGAQIERINQQPELQIGNTTKTLPSGKDYDYYLDVMLSAIRETDAGKEIEGFGHRVAHGGVHFDEAVWIDGDVISKIESLIELAPIHNTANLAGIKLAVQHFPGLRHVAVFDTAFHRTMPRRAQWYALPYEISREYGLQRYGFHGTSHKYVAERAADYLNVPINTLRIITCHLGSGCSLAAIEYGRSVETTMGMTPLEGMVMATRCGDIDPGMISYLMKKANLSIDELDNILSHESGLKGLSGISGDMRDILAKSTMGDDRAQLALQVFTHRLRKHIGALAAVMGGVDIIIFTGGIGENSPTVRHRASQRLEFLGAMINEDTNHDANVSRQEDVKVFSWNHSRVKLMTVRTDEQLSIARQTDSLFQEKSNVNVIPHIPIAVSARHMHITQETLEKLFGAGYQLTPRNPLSQPGQFAAKESVTVVGPRNAIEKVRILGPVRPKNQIEVSRTDEFFLGIDAPIRESGRTENTPGCTVIGPKGKVVLDEGLICAWRHIHMKPEDAALFGVKDGDIVDVRVNSSERALTFGNVLIRVSDKFNLEMHIDTDEANAAEISHAAKGTLVHTDSEAVLQKRKVG